MKFFRKSLDYENLNSYALRLNVNDGGGIITECQLTINVRNVNESPNITSGQIFYIDENSSVETIVKNVDGNEVSVSIYDYQYYFVYYYYYNYAYIL